MAAVVTAARSKRDLALDRANEVRQRRAAFKRDVKAGRVQVADVLAGDSPDWLAGMTVFDLLAAQPRFGPARITRVLGRIPVSEWRKVGELTPRQRALLARMLLDGEA